MPKKKPKSKYSSMKKLREVTAQTNSLCVQDEESDAMSDNGKPSRPQLSSLSEDYHEKLLTDLERYSNVRFSGRCESRKSSGTNFTCDVSEYNEFIQNELSAKDIADLSEIFSIFDVENSGEVSFIDLLRSMRFLRFRMDEKELTEILQSLNGGRAVSATCNVSIETFLSCVIEAQNRRTDWSRQIVQVFHCIDVGGKGVISMNDLKFFNRREDLGFCEIELDEMIRAADLNKDGVVDKHEFVNIMSQTNLFS